MGGKTGTALTFGAIIGVILVVATWFGVNSSGPTRSVIDIISFAAVPLGVFFAQFFVRGRAAGAVSYGDAFGTGFMTALFAALVAAIGTYAAVMIDPSLSEAVRAEAEAEIRRQRMPADQREMVEAITNWTTSGMGLATLNFFSTLIFGTLVALVTSIFTRKSG